MSSSDPNRAAGADWRQLLKAAPTSDEEPAFDDAPLPMEVERAKQAELKQRLTLPPNSGLSPVSDAEMTEAVPMKRTPFLPDPPPREEPGLLATDLEDDVPIDDDRTIALRPKPKPTPADNSLGALNDLLKAPAAPAAGDGSAEVKRLKAENAELRRTIDEIKQLLQEAAEQEERFLARERDLQDQLDEKIREVSDLHEQLQAIEESIASGTIGAPAAPKTRGELEELADELDKQAADLEKQRKRLDADRAQLREDEAALEKQMRTMEMQMSKERALMARQEIELKRLSAEIQRQIENMSKGGYSTDIVGQLRGRHDEVMRGPAAAPPPQQPQTGSMGGPTNPRDSGVLRRFFGSGPQGK